MNKNTAIPINKIITTKDTIIIKYKKMQDLNKIKLKIGTNENAEVEIKELKKPRIKIIGADNEFQKESNKDIEVSTVLISTKRTRKHKEIHNMQPTTGTFVSHLKLSLHNNTEN